MKKPLFISVVTLLLLLSSCGNGGENDDAAQAYAIEEITPWQHPDISGSIRGEEVSNCFTISEDGGGLFLTKEDWYKVEANEFSYCNTDDRPADGDVVFFILYEGKDSYSFKARVIPYRLAKKGETVDYESFVNWYRENSERVKAPF